MSGRVAEALTAAQDWLIEPPAPRAPVSLDGEPRPVVAVYGLARGCGSTVVARALAAELAVRDGGAAAVGLDEPGSGIGLATPAATRLARRLNGLPGAGSRPVGRLCLVRGAAPAALADLARGVAPLVFDAGSAAVGGVPAALADAVVLVAPVTAEPSLAAVAAECLARVGPEPFLAVVGGSDGWQGCDHVSVPRSRAAAQLALGGREARGELGRAIGRIADLLSGRRKIAGPALRPIA